MTAISNRFTVLSLVEDLTLSSDAGGDLAAELAARARAIKHLPSLGVTLGQQWTDYEVGPFLMHCVLNDDGPVVCAIADAVPRFVKHFGIARVAEPVVGLAGSSSVECRNTLRRTVPELFLDVEGNQPDDREPARLLLQDICTDLLAGSPWPAARSTALVWAASPQFALSALCDQLRAGADSAARQQRPLKELDDGVRHALQKCSSTLRTDPVQAHIQWVFIAACPEAAEGSLLRLLVALAVAGGRGSNAERELLAVAPALAKQVRDCGLLESGRVNASRRHIDAAEEAVGSAAALVDSLVSGGACALTLCSVVPWAAEAGLQRAARLIDLLGAVIIAAGPRRDAVCEMLADLVLRLLREIEGLSGHVDFRVRLLFGRHFTSVVLAAARYTAGLGERIGSALPLVTPGDLIGDMLLQAVRGLAQDPESDVRCEAAQAVRVIAEGMSRDAAPLTAFVTTKHIAELIGLCDQARFDPVPFVREAIAPAIGALVRATLSREAVDGRDRQSLYTMLLELLRDEASSVQLASSIALSHCVTLVGRTRVEKDLCEAAAPLLQPTTMWRAREVLAVGVPKILELFALPPVDAPVPESARPSGQMAPMGQQATAGGTTERTLFDDEEPLAADDVAPASPTGPPMPGDSGVMRLTCDLLLDPAKAVRDAALNAVVSAVLRMLRRLRQKDFTVVRFEILGLPAVASDDAADPWEILRAGLWPLVAQADAPKTKYQLRMQQLQIAAAFRLSFDRVVFPLITRQSMDPVANVVRSAALMIEKGLKQARQVDDFNSEIEAFEAMALTADDADVAQKSVALVSAVVAGRLFAVPTAVRQPQVLPLLREMLENKSVDVRDAAAAALTACT